MIILIIDPYVPSFFFSLKLTPLISNSDLRCLPQPIHNCSRNVIAIRVVDSFNVDYLYTLLV